MKAILILALAAALFAAPASAQTAVANGARAIFLMSDVNNDGRLSRVEFDAGREEFFARSDLNNDGRLTFSELRALRPEGAPRLQRVPSREQFQSLRAIDRNHDRAVDINEFRSVGGDRFATADRNRDGFISGDEISNLVQAMRIGN